MADDGEQQLARLKKLAQELDAARDAVDDTVKHIESAKQRADRIVSGETGKSHTAAQTKRKRPASKAKRTRKTAKKAKKATRRR